MKRLFILFLLLTSIVTGGQIPQKINTWYEYQRFMVDSLLAIPKDTVKVPANFKNYPYLGSKNDTIYAWSYAANKWVSIKVAEGRKESALGSIYNKSSWANLSDFAVNSAGVTVSGTKLSFPSGVGDYSKSLETNYITGLEKWKQEAKFAIDEKSATSYGFGLGIRSVNSSGTFVCQGLGWFDASGGPGAGKVYFDAGNTGMSTVSQSITSLPFSQGDTIVLAVERNQNIMTVQARNATTGSDTVSTTFAYSFGAGAYPYQINTGRFAIYSIGGQFTVASYSIQSKEIKNASIMVIGDSKTNGSVVSDISKRFVSLLNNSFATTIANCGQGDKTGEFKQLVPEILALAPKQVILAMGSNDIRLGISSATWQANYLYIKTALELADIEVYHALPFREAYLNQSALSTYIKNTFPSTKIIDTETPLNNAVGVNGDSYHPNDYGHSIIFKAIVESGKLKYANRLGLPEIYLRNQLINAQPFSYWINGEARSTTLKVNGLASVDSLSIAGNTTFKGGQISLVTGNDYYNSPTFKSAFLMYIKAMGNYTVFRGGNGNADRPVIQLETEPSTSQTQMEMRGFNSNPGTIPNTPFYIYTTGLMNGGAGDIVVKTGAPFTSAAGSQFGNYDIYLMPSGTGKVKFSTIMNLPASTPPTSSADATGATGDVLMGTDGNIYRKDGTLGWVKFTGATF